MFLIKKDVPAFTVNTGEINIQVDKATSQENLAIVAAMPEYADLISEVSDKPEVQSKVSNSKATKNED
jgi:hypothetical protein